MRRLAPDVRRRIFDALDRFVEDTTRGDIRRLRGTDDEWRLRVGDWRIRFAFRSDTRTVEVLRVLPRGRAYRD
jgi:mRNA interferase RelE/StbE